MRIRLLFSIIFCLITFQNIRSQNLLEEDLENWAPGQDAVKGFHSMGSLEQNTRLYATGPFGETELLWKATPDDDGDQNGGGFTSSPYNIDFTKDYRFTVWLKKTGTTEGLSYLGAWGPSHVLEIFYGTVDDNPLFLADQLPNLDTWYLAVGFIHNSAYNSTESIGRLYDQQGVEVGILRDYKWATWSSRVSHRAFSYFDTNPSNDLYLFAPRMEEVNENTPDINTLLRLEDTKNIEFQYDIAGNQKLRKPPGEERIARASPALALLYNNQAIEEDKLEVLYDPDAIPDPLSLLEETIKIFPNPTSGNLKITWSGQHDYLITNVTVSDFAGKNIPITYNQGDFLAQTDLGRYPPGSYLVNFILRDGRTIGKKIIKK